jgi:hypothetical protein
MASKEGFRRITSIGRWMAIAGAFLLLGSFFTSLWESRSPHSYSSAGFFASAGFFMLPGVYLSIYGWLALAIGWIGAGFSLTRESDDDSV